jgi:MFS family permease
LLTIHDASQVWVFYVVGFLNSSVSQFFVPARGAVLPLIVTDKEDWMPANGLMQIVQTLGLLAGPALAGFAIDAWGESAAFIANSIAYMLSAAAVYTMQVPRTTLERGSTGLSVPVMLTELREGIGFMLSNRSTLGVLICLSVANLGLGAINVIWVPYLERTFGIGASGLGIVDSVQGIGMVVSGLALGFIATRISKPLLASIGVCIIGVLFALMGYSPFFYLIIIESFGVGLALVPVQSALATIQQIAVPDLKRGRVASSMSAVTTGGGLISMALASFLGEAVGLNRVYLIIGGFIFISGILGFWLLREPEDIGEVEGQALSSAEGPRSASGVSEAADEQITFSVKAVMPEDSPQSPDQR